MAGDHLKQAEFMLNKGKKYAETGCRLSGAQSHDKLSQRVFELQEGGSSALGPALLAALGMTSDSPGSKIMFEHCIIPRAH